MREPEERYRRLTQQLVWQRVQRAVSLAEEARYTEELDQCWFELTPEEREDVERWFTELRRIDSLTILPLVDVSLQEEAPTLPRERC